MPETATVGTQEDLTKFIASRKGSTAASPTVTAAAPIVAPATTEVVSEETAAATEEAAPVTGSETEHPNRATRRKPLQQAWEREQALNAKIAELERQVAGLSKPEKVETMPAIETAPTAADAEQALTDAAQARIRPKPKREEIGTTYATYEDYVEDCAIWGGELAAEKRAVQAEFQEARSLEVQRQQTFAEHWQAEKSAYPDFDAVIASSRVEAPVVEEAIKRQPQMAAHLVYFLGKHPEEFARIAALAPEDTFLEIGHLAATLKAERGHSKETPAKESKAPKQSTAPAPVGVASRAAVPEAKLENVTSYADYNRIRNAQIAAKRPVR